MKIVLLNPPAGRVLQRDHYCSVTSKTGHYWPPIDLLLHSGLLAQEHEVHVVDGIVEGASDGEAMAAIRAQGPDVIVALSSILSAGPDLDFLKRCKQLIGCKVVLMGDLCYFFPELLIQSDAVDAVCVQYPAQGLLDYLRGEPEAVDMVFKRDGAIRIGRRSQGALTFPPPAHEKFPLAKYRLPLVHRTPFSMVVTAISCPMRCSYCPVSTVGYRERPLNYVLEELDRLETLGIRELFFVDMMFNANLRRAKELCREMVRRNYRFGWTAMVRPDRSDPELLEVMRAAGCHTVMFGIDSADSEILRNHERDTDLKKVSDAFSRCRGLGLKSLAFLILGLPGETEQSARASIRFACAQDCDYLSVNLFVPRLGSRFMRQYGSLAEILNDHSDLDSSLGRASYCAIPSERLVRLKRYALLRFYLRPSLLFGHLLNLGSWHHLSQLLIRGSRLLFHHGLPGSPAGRKLGG